MTPTVVQLCIIDQLLNKTSHGAVHPSYEMEMLGSDISK